jgi:7-cyano-7-deazaguanine reductase
MDKISMTDFSIEHPALELGKKSAYENHYNPDKLFPILRDEKRLEIGISPNALPFYGYDLWNHYEVSWLNPKGKPMVAIAEIIYSCHSPSIIESKSMKLYFNTFNQTRFQDKKEVEQTIQKDLEAALQHPVRIQLFNLEEASYLNQIQAFKGIHLDNLDVDCDEYQPNAQLLKIGAEEVEETLYSNLLKSNCLVTFQPDWGSIQIHYIGQKIQHASLLQYFITFRNHNEFHEQCIERIFQDIMQQCQPKSLTVYGRYTRRGGVDINPIRSTEKNIEIKKMRLIRQ